MFNKLIIKIKEAKKNILYLFTKAEILKFVHDEDLVDLLTSLNLKEDIIAGKYKCFNCGDKITMDNLQALIKNNKEIKFICSKADCINHYNDSRRT